MKKNNFNILLMLALLSLSTLSNANNSYYLQRQLNKADNLFEQGNYVQALKLYELVAKSTVSSYSQFRIAWIYNNGLGVKKDCKEAVRWYTRAANRRADSVRDTSYATVGNIAQNNLYAIYTKGCPGVNLNPLLGVKYLKMSAESGNSRAQANLANLYVVGEFVEKNPYQAYDLAQRSAKQNDISGIMLLADFYINGTGVPKNFSKAYSLLNSAATMDVLDFDKETKQKAQLFIGILLFEGKGFPVNIKKAYQWFLLATGGENKDISSTAAQYIKEIEKQLPQEEIINLAEKANQINKKSTYLSDEELLDALYQAFNDKKQSAIKLAKILSNKGNPKGETVLGVMYRDGFLNIKKDIDESYILFKRACKSDEWLACSYQLKTLVETGRTDDANNLLDNISLKTPNTSEYQNILAELYLLLNRKNESKQVIRKILASEPENETSKSILSKINGT